MIGAIAFLAAGALLVVLAVVLHKKMGRGWTASLAVAGVLLAACGGWLTQGQLAQREQVREDLYVALQYLQQGESESASFYIKKAGAAENFPAAAARYLLERVRGNELNAQLNYDSALSMADEDGKSLLLLLERADLQDPQQVTLAVSQLSRELGLSPEREETLARFVQAESGGALWDDLTMAQAGLDETALSRLRISSLLSQGDYEGAVSEASALVEEDSSADNRLLLAETVAESAYQNVILISRSFEPGRAALGDAPPFLEGTIFGQAAVSGGETGLETNRFFGDEGTSAEERQELDEERMALERDLAALEITLNSATGEELARLNEEKLALTEEIQDLQRRADKLFVYRAFNAIADLHSLEAQLVRARLYFALQDHDQAVETLLDSAGSLQAKLTADRTLANNLRIVEEAYSSETEPMMSQEFQDAMTQLLSAPFPDLMYISQNQLTQDFVQRIVSDQKDYGQSLYLSRLDVSAFPQVEATLAGRQEILERIAQQENVTVRDTRQDVSYTAQIVEGVVANICVVVDRSGSMDGTPMENLKEALDEFVRNSGVDTPISLVAFDDTYELLTELSTDKASLLNTVQAIQIEGGTDITEGIRGGSEALAEASGSRVMLLMTDGQSSIDFSVVEEAADQGITIHTIGFGSVNDELLEEIAQATGGQYVRADSSEELSNIYASLQQIIGNVITVQYTAPDPEDVDNRYFYLQSESSSVRVEYFLTDEEETAQVQYGSPALVRPEQMTRWAENGSTFRLSLYGSNLMQVTGVTVGGQAAQIDRQEETYLQLTVSPLMTPGWQTVSLTLESGETQTYDRLLLVADSQYYRNIRLGSLTIPYAQGALPGDGTLVLAGTGIRLEENRSLDGSSLALSVDGTLILPWNQPVPVEGEAAATQNVNLGDQGEITGWGRVLLQGSDSAYDRSAPDTVAQGALRLECAADQSRLIQEEESEG